jgi:hypothetical protein
MALTGAHTGPGGSRGRDPNLLGAEEFATLLGFPRKQTLTKLAAAGEVPGAGKVGRVWLFHLPTFYTWLAGPGVPYGRIVESAELAGRLGASRWVVRNWRRDPGDAVPAGESGNAGRAAAGVLAGVDGGRGLPGRHVGKKVLFAVPAVWMRMGWPLDDFAVPRDGRTRGAHGREPGLPAAAAQPRLRQPGGRGRSPASLDIAAADVPVPPVAGRGAGQPGRKRPAARGPRAGGRGTTSR